MDYKDVSQENLDKHIDHLLDIIHSIPLGQITILTGGNALGKSLIRKQLVFKIQEDLKAQGKEVDLRKIVTSVSMQSRTECRPEFGALSTGLHDLPWCSTSDHTISLLTGMLKEVKDRFIVIDELEIGMSKEVQAGCCMFLNTVIPELLKSNYGFLIITHSDVVVRNLKHDNFINIEGFDESGWLNREIIPVDPEDVRKWATELFVAIRDREKKK